MLRPPHHADKPTPPTIRRHYLRPKPLPPSEPGKSDKDAPGTPSAAASGTPVLEQEKDGQGPETCRDEVGGAETGKAAQVSPVPANAEIDAVDRDEIEGADLQIAGPPDPGPTSRRAPADETTADDPDGESWQLLAAADRVTVTVILIGCFLLMLLSYCQRLVTGDRLIEIDRAPLLHADFAVDINLAQWPELAMMPGIGPTLARRIIEFREEHGPFTQVDQLEQVKGIGPKTMQRVRPMVRIGKESAGD